MEERQKSNKFWVYLFCFCLVTIIGLATAVIILQIVNNNKGDSTYIIYGEDQIAESTNIAVEDSHEIDSYYYSMVYDREDVINKYEEKMNSENDAPYKLAIAIAYSRILYEIDGFDSAMEVIKRVEVPQQASMQIDYYSALRDLYEKESDTEKAEYYDNLVINLMDDEDL